MHNDIVIEVIDKIKSGKPILVMQAILTGIEAKITDEAFIEEIKNNKDRNAVNHINNGSSYFFVSSKLGIW